MRTGARPAPGYRLDKGKGTDSENLVQKYPFWGHLTLFGYSGKMGAIGYYQSYQTVGPFQNLGKFMIEVRRL